MPAPQRRLPPVQTSLNEERRPPRRRAIYMILGNLSANKTPAIRAWAQRHHVELCFTRTNASWAATIFAVELVGGSPMMPTRRRPSTTVAAPAGARRRWDSCCVATDSYRRQAGSCRS